MGKRIEDNVKISNNSTVGDWKKEREILIKDIHNQNHNLDIWDNAYGYFYKRIKKIIFGNYTDKLIELEDDNLNKMIIYRENFQKALIQYLENYKDELLQNKNLMINFIRKFDDICDIERSYYFAYGSNLSKNRLLERIGKFHTASVAILKGYKFIYNKKSVDGTAKANLIKEPNSKVYGVCYEIDRDDLNILRNYEKGYDDRKLTVSLIDFNTDAEVNTYISQSITEQPVSKDYRQIIIQGAKEWGIDQNYINNSL